MAGSTFGRWSLLLGAALAVSACQDNGRSDTGVVGASPTFAQAGVRVNRSDVEAPDVFEKTETGLWDGRPSLGGVWVAHPDVTSPERVSIVNQANGKSIVGALFRRERANPGPRIQISSDAAAQLDVLAGQPTMLRVVALKRQEELQDAPAEEAPAAAAAEAGEAPATAEPAAETTGAAAVAAETTAILGEPGDAADPQPVAEDRPPTSFGRRRQAAEPTPPAEPDAAAEAALAAPSAEAPPAAQPETPAAEPLSAVTDPAAGAAPLPADAALADPQPMAEDAPPTSFGRRRPRADAAAEPLPAPAEGEDISVAPLDGAAPAAAPEPASTIRFPFIQAAAFGTEANANAAADRLRGAGVTAEVRNAGSVWRVLAGPVGSAAEQASLLAKVKGLGYSDAYPVRN
jgi:hypothetical protein